MITREPINAENVRRLFEDCLTKNEQAHIATRLQTTLARLWDTEATEIEYEMMKYLRGT